MAANVRYSDWIWSEEHRRHYCGVYDARTNKLLQYQWEGGATQPVKGSQSSTASAQQTSQASPPQHHASSSDPRRPRSIPSPDGEEDEDEDEDEEAEEASLEVASNRSSGSPTQSYTTAPHPRSSVTASPYTYGASSSATSRSGYTVKAYGQSTTTQPSYTTYSQSYDTSRPANANTYYSSKAPSRHDSYYQTASSPEEKDEAELQEKVETITNSKLQRNLRTGNDGIDHESLNPVYRRVQKGSHHEFFVRGRVFSMLWSEPAGHVKPGGTRGSTHFSLTWLGGTAYTEIRRFVVMRNKGTFSQCIPIQTYRRQGVTKSGVIAGDHAVVHTSTYPPELIPGEVGILTKNPIRIHPAPNQSLETQSRVNFGKPYTVEHNVKLLEIGMVAKEHIHLLETYFREAMGFY